MKKLLFAIAGAASFAALAADPTPGANDIDVLGFENFDLTDTANVSGAVVERTDSGIGGTSKWSCQGDDASLVKTYGGDNAAKGNGLTFPGPFEDEGDQYLALDTNGSELKRAIPSDQDQNVVPAAGMYIDTLVQFTPSESAPTSTDLDGAKLAIWLGVVNNVTNLYVQGNAWDIDEGFQGTEQAFALSGKTIEPGTWYRLTVKAIPNVLGSDTGSSISAFQISVDGTDMTLAASPFSADMLTTLAEYGAAAWASADIQTAFAANKLVPAIQEEIGSAGAPLTLTTVGFKGTGALDDFVVTTNAPSASAGYPTYLDDADATIKAKYDTWKAGVGCDDATASQYQNQFLLNVDENTLVGDTALEITAITQNETAGWDITIGCSISGVGLTGEVGSTIVCNGYLAVSYTDDLTNTWTTENIEITSVDATAGTVTVNVNKSGAKFMKVKLSATAEPQPQN